MSQAKSQHYAGHQDGLPAGEFKEELATIAAEREQTQAVHKNAEQAPVVLNLDLAKRYFEEVAQLQDNMAQGDNLHEAAQLLQKVITKIVLTPNADKTDLQIDIQGNFAGMLAVATNQDNLLPLMEGLHSPQLCTKTNHLTI